MKFCADHSPLDIECSILDIQQGSGLQRKMILLQKHFVQNELRQFIFIAEEQPIEYTKTS